jgi:predicted transposase YbfD/YdcC
MISAWASSNRVILGQLKTSSKSKEITAIPELLESLALEGCIVTIDAMGCQKDIARHIVDQGADYVLALKGNQETIHTKVVAFFEQRHEQKQNQEPQQPEREDAYYETVDGDHGRVEIRRYRQITDLRW